MYLKNVQVFENMCSSKLGQIPLSRNPWPWYLLVLKSVPKMLTIKSQIQIITISYEQ